MEFAKYIERIRSGDQDACEQFVREYGPCIISEARKRLQSTRVAQDAEDVCQSVLKSFFHRAVRGKYDLGHPSQLVALLVSMARNKSVNRIRYQQSRSGTVSTVSFRDADSAAADSSPPASDQVAADELMDYYASQLSRENVIVLKRRMSGCTWPEIASELGDSAEALRKRFKREIQLLDHRKKT